MIGRVGRLLLVGLAVLVAWPAGGAGQLARALAAEDGDGQRSGVRSVRPEPAGSGFRTAQPTVAGEPVEVLAPNRDAVENSDQQNEPSIAVNPASPSRMVAAANDY